jgi:SLOG family YspA-like protein
VFADRPRVLVTGSRTWPDPARVHAALDTARERWPDMLVVHGACPRGADAMAHAWCLTAGVPVLCWPADWSRYGRAAGMRRNAAMVAEGAVVCLAFIHHNSRGASHCAGLAEAAGIPVRRYTTSPTSDGLIWWSAPSGTVGLVVAAGRVVDCPPYAARWALGADARVLWRRGARTPGVTLAWVPDPPAGSGGGAATSATSATGQVRAGFSCRGCREPAATSATNPRHDHHTGNAPHQPEGESR